MLCMSHTSAMWLGHAAVTSQTSSAVRQSCQGCDKYPRSKPNCSRCMAAHIDIYLCGWAALISTSTRTIRRLCMHEHCVVGLGNCTDGHTHTCSHSSAGDTCPGKHAAEDQSFMRLLTWFWSLSCNCMHGSCCQPSDGPVHS